MEGCSSSDGVSCYPIRYIFSPDGAWLGAKRPQDFGERGFATVVALEAGIVNEVDYSGTGESSNVAMAGNRERG
jgi:hypothetical protein